MNEKDKSSLKINCYLIVGLVFLLNFKFNITILNTIPYSFTITLFLNIVYRKIIWKHNPFNKIPVLKKKYIGNLLSTYDNKKRVVELEIKQNYDSLFINMKTKESSSSSVSANIILENGNYYLIFTYNNIPQQKHKDRSKIHFGTCKLLIEKNKLSGFYFTDRKTTGDICVVEKDKTL